MHRITQSHINILEEHGFCLIENFFTPQEMETAKGLPANRNVRFCLNKIPALQVFADKVVEELRHHFKEVLFNRSIFFNKTPEKNWSVLWHQDLTLCVKEKLALEGYGPWSVKEGIHHVQAPRKILEEMVSARIQIDSCNEENGVLKVISGSHKEGILSREQIQKNIQNNKASFCNAKEGSLLLMKPLILHSSDSSLRSNSSRRVLHIELLTQTPEHSLQLYHY